MPFDPYTLPDEPIVAIDIGVDPGGREYATVDGVRVEQGDGESARAAAVRAVAALVDELPPFGPLGRAPAGVRARINGPGFRDYDIAVDRDGRLYVPIGSPQDMALRSAAASRHAGEVVSDRGVDRAGAEAGGTALAATTAAGTAAAGGVTTAEESGNRAGAGPSRLAIPRPASGASTPVAATTATRTPRTPVAPALPGRPWPGEPATGQPSTGESSTAERNGHASGASAAATSDAEQLADTRTAANRVNPTPPARDARPITDRAATNTTDAQAVDAPDSVVVSTPAVAGTPTPRGDWSRTFLDETSRPAGGSAASGLIAPPPASLRSERLAGLVQSARELRPRAPSTQRRELRADPGSARRRPFRPAVAMVVLAALIVLAGLAAIVWSFLHPRDGRAGASAGVLTGQTFPGTVPPGWSENPRWVSRTLEAGGGRVLPVGDGVAYVDADHGLELVDATTGTNRWRVPLPPGTLRDGLAHTTIGGAEVVAVQVDDTLAWWRVADGRGGGTLALPAGASASFLGAAPLIGVDERTVAVVDDSALQRIRIPSGAYALAADATGRVTAASGSGWWHLRPGVAAGAVTPWERASPDDEAPRATPSVVGYLGDSVLVLHPQDRQGRLHVVTHTDGPVVRLSFRGQVAAMEKVSQPWWPSPSGTWGVLGRTLVDLKAGSVTDLGAWTTTWITADRAYGTLDGHTVQAGPGVPRTEIGADVTIPEVITAAGAAVRAKDGGGERLYLLPPSS